MGQVNVEFPGLQGWLRAEYAKTKGVTPSMCIVWTDIQPDLDASVGTLTLSHGSQQISLNKAAVRTSHIRKERFRNAYVWRIPIVDRRWKWSYCRISGEYNRRLPDDTVDDSIDNNKKTARELAEILMEALQETGFDVAALPDDVYPYVNWKDSYAAIELAAVCDYCHADPGLSLDDRAFVYARGQGADLPTTDLVTPIVPLLPSERPKGLIACLNDTLFQNKLILEAVGRDVDDSWVPIDDLSYAPSGGWENENPLIFAGVAIEQRHLALETVFRAYRVQEQATGASGELAPPGCDEEVETIEQLLPLNDYLVDYDPDNPDERNVVLPAYIQGIFWPLCDHAINTPEVARYVGEFSILKNQGVVLLEYPCYQWDDGDIVPAELYLTTSFRVRKKDDRDYVSREIERTLSGSEETEPLPLKHHELWEYYRQEYNDDDPTDPGSLTDNVSDVETEANVYLTLAESQWTARFIADAYYFGLIQIDVDGALPQIVWSLGKEEDCVTRICLTEEMDIHVPSPDERQRRDRVMRLQERSLTYAPPG